QRGRAERAVGAEDIRRQLALFTELDDKAFISNQGSKPFRLGDARRFLAELDEGGSTEVRLPWEGPDRLNQGVGWLPNLWSPDALRRRVEAVGSAALEVYRQTVERWFPRFAPQLSLWAMWPVELFGCIVPGDPAKGLEHGNSFVWTIRPAHSEAQATFLIVSDEHEAFRVVREEANKRSPYSWGEIHGIFGTSPCS